MQLSIDRVYSFSAKLAVAGLSPARNLLSRRWAHEPISENEKDLLNCNDRFSFWALLEKVFWPAPARLQCTGNL